MPTKKPRDVFKNISIDLIDRPDALARMDIHAAELNELTASIKDRGLMQPIEVTPRGDRYLIVFGDRRFLAHKQLGKTTIMCRVETLTDTEVLIDRAMENLQSVDLTPFEEAHQYAKLMEYGKLSLEEVSKKVGISTGTVQRRLAIFRMPDSYQQAIHSKQISLSVAEELWSCPDAAKREYFLQMAVDHGITKAVARSWVDEYKKSLRRSPSAGEGGAGAPLPYDDTPIFRACDICRNPVEYKDVHDLRICPNCFKLITESLQKT